MGGDNRKLAVAVLLAVLLVASPAQQPVHAWSFSKVKQTHALTPMHTKHTTVTQAILFRLLTPLYNPTQAWSKLFSRAYRFQ